MVAFPPRGCFAAQRGDAADLVHRKGAAAGSLDGWGWREFKALPVSWFDGLARILSKVEDSGVWPEGLLDASLPCLLWLTLMLLLWVSGLLVFFPLLIVFGPLLGCCSWRVGFNLGSLSLSLDGRSSVEAWCTTALDIEEVFSGVADSDVHLFVADVVKSFDTLDWGHFG